MSPIVSAAFLKFQEKGVFEKQAFFEETLIFFRNKQPFSGKFLNLLRNKQARFGKFLIFHEIRSVFEIPVSHERGTPVAHAMSKTLFSPDALLRCAPG